MPELKTKNKIYLVSTEKIGIVGPTDGLIWDCFEDFMIDIKWSALKAAPSVMISVRILSCRCLPFVFSCFFEGIIYSNVLLLECFRQIVLQKWDTMHELFVSLLLIFLSSRRLKMFQGMINWIWLFLKESMRVGNIGCLDVIMGTLSTVE